MTSKGTSTNACALGIFVPCCLTTKSLKFLECALKETGFVLSAVQSLSSIVKQSEIYCLKTASIVNSERLSF